ncbi:hypothetical protein KC344_g205 [Hortaea werneckii]|nr:hypothetical protein KC344_g205 [Hortaea werneckii]
MSQAATLLNHVVDSAILHLTCISQNQLAHLRNHGENLIVIFHFKIRGIVHHHRTLQHRLRQLSQLLNVIVMPGDLLNAHLDQRLGPSTWLFLLSLANSFPHGVHSSPPSGPSLLYGVIVVVIVVVWVALFTLFAFLRCFTLLDLLYRVLDWRGLPHYRPRLLRLDAVSAHSTLGAADAVATSPTRHVAMSKVGVLDANQTGEDRK